jgi:hypothetical protein
VVKVSSMTQFHLRPVAASLMSFVACSPCHQGRTEFEGACVKESVVDYVTCFRQANGAHIISDRGYSLDQEAKILGQDFTSKVDYRNKLEQVFTGPSKDDARSIITNCVRLADSTGEPSTGQVDNQPKPSPHCNGTLLAFPEGDWWIRVDEVDTGSAPVPLLLAKRVPGGGTAIGIGQAKAGAIYVIDGPRDVGVTWRSYEFNPLATCIQPSRVPQGMQSGWTMPIKDGEPSTLHTRVTFGAGDSPP